MKYLILLLLFLGCTSTQYQRAVSTSKKPWGKCLISPNKIFKSKSINLYRLSDNKKTWIEGHLSLKNQSHSLRIISELETKSTDKYCAFKMTYRREGIKSVTEYSEVVDCSKGMRVARDVYLKVKAEKGSWENLKLRCKKIN